MEDWFRKRILYDGPIEEILDTICELYGFEGLKDYRIIRKGYQELNIQITTEKGQYLVKIFRKTKKDEACERYVNLMERAVKAGVRHPELIEAEGSAYQKMEIKDTSLRFCVMEFIEGTGFDNLSRGLKDDEIEFIARQAAIINSMEAEPYKKWDSWSVTNFLYEFAKCHEFLDEKDRKIIEPLVEKFRQVDISQLPHCFVHNDLRETNIIKGKDERLWVLDFGVSDRHPRIQEIAVAATAILYPGNQKEMEENLEAFLGEYQKHIDLTQKELELLDLFIDVAHAMEVIRPTFEKKAKGNESEENEYWLEQGREKLRQRLD